MTLSTRHSGPVAIVRFEGRLALSPALYGIKTQIEHALSSQPSTGLVLDLAGVPGIDSAGLGELVAVYSTATKRGVRVAVAGANAHIREALAITRLDGIFPLCPDEESALQSLAQPKVSDQA